MAFRGYIRFPTIHRDTIVFTADDDLWQVSASGGRAERLTAGVSLATHAQFSPDGARLAFTGREEGPAEVYVIPADGGPARRLTFDGVQANVVAWRPDGSAIIYESAASQPSRRMHVLQQVAPDGGESTVLPYGIAHSIAFGPNSTLVLGRNTNEPATWKRYRGGTAGYLWIAPAGDGEFHRLPDLKGNVTHPCWVGDRLYFISDHEGIGNVYSCLATGEDLCRHTNQTEYYARGLATDGSRLVYHAGGDLFLLDPGATEGARLDVQLAGTRAQLARQFVAPGKFMDSWAPHPQGHAVAVTTRGKSYSFGNWEGAVRQHGDANATRYRLAQWLADGKRIAAISDTGAEPRLAVVSADGSAPDRVFADLDIGHVVDHRAAPVGDNTALVNHRNEVLLVDTSTGQMRTIDRSKWGRSESSPVESMREMRGLAWSPDGQWLAYAIAIGPRRTGIKLCRVATGETFQATEPVLHDILPAFDPNGKYLYFLSLRDFDPVQDDLLFDFGFPKGMRPFLLTLRRDLRSPFVPEPQPPKSEAAEQLEAAKSEQQQPETPAPVQIDLDDIASRIVAFPVAEGRYGRVQGTHEGVLFSSFPVEGTRKQDLFGGMVPPANGALDAYHFETHKQERIADGISDFAVTADGKTLLYRAGERLRVLKAGEKPQQQEGDAANKPGRESGWLDLDRVKVSLEPAAEWRQMFGEAWRLQREQYWVADMAGTDWKRAYDRYTPLLNCSGSRAELSDLIWELQGELGTSHSYEFGGEYRPHPEYTQGHLGVDWRFDPATGRYTIARIVRGDPWDPEATSPLLTPGANVADGDAVLAINGQRITPERGPRQLLVNQAGQEVELLIQPADGSAPRSVTVRAAGNPHAGRYRDWVEANRRAVHEATGGRVGYLHIPDMMFDGFAEFHRYYLQEFDHEGLIVDIRWNGGGMVSSLVLEKLARPRLGYSFPRYGDPDAYFYESPRGAIIAVTDENAGSDGDIFSHAFKMLKLGPLVGKRTWGGVIGIEPYMPLADGTMTTQPEFSFWFKDVGWGVENYGTDPTIEVDNPPQAYAAGKDPQLERAIAEAVRLVAEGSYATPEPGPHPNRGFPPRG